MKVMEVTTNRTFKSRLFEMIFSDRQELLALYNAVNGTDYTDPEKLKVNTLENAIYMSMHNDISFIIDSRLSLYEHQSTYSPNLPLRYLFYSADLYSDIVKDSNLYGSKLVEIPTPKFIIFYNGLDEYPDRKELKLSSAYSVQDKKPSLELKATLLNINLGHNKKLMKACKTLRDYSEYVARVRRSAQIMDIEDAVERAITECIQEGILSEFLKKNRAEAKKVSIYEYDEEKHMRQTREEGFEDGYGDGYNSGYGNGYHSGFDEGKVAGSLSAYKKLSVSKEMAMSEIIETYGLSFEKAQEMMEKYWSADHE